VANLGWPEARIPLAQTTIYLACSPKSNSAIKAIDAALSAVAAGEILPVPDHLKDAHYEGAKKLGRGVDYKYPHDYGGYVPQAYTTRPVHFVEFVEVGFEKRLSEWLERIRSHDPGAA
jgi:putative ATPase